MSSDEDFTEKDPLRIEEEGELEAMIVDGSEEYEPSLIAALFRTFWRSLMAGAVLKLMQDILVFVNPQILR